MKDRKGYEIPKTTAYGTPHSSLGYLQQVNNTSGFKKSNQEKLMLSDIEMATAPLCERLYWLDSATR